MHSNGGFFTQDYGHTTERNLKKFKNIIESDLKEVSIYEIQRYNAIITTKTL